MKGSINMFCPQCGTKLNDDMLFCPSCGTKIKKDPVPIQQRQPVMQVYEEPVVYSNNNANGYSNNYDVYFENQQPAPPVGAKTKSNNSKLIFGIVGAVVAVIAVVTVAFLFLGKGGTSDISIISSPSDDLFDSITKTVFESQSASISIDGEMVGRIGVNFSIGEGFDDVRFCSKSSYDTIGVKNGILYLDGDATDMREVIYEYTAEMRNTFEIPDVISTADKLFSNKIDETTFSDLYNTTGREFYGTFLKRQYVSNLDSYESEQYIDRQNNKLFLDKIPLNTELPAYDALMNLCKKLLKKCVDEDAITIEKDGDYYNYSANVTMTARCALDFVREEKILSNIVSTIAILSETSEAELYAEVEEEIYYLAEHNIVVNGRYKIENGYLVYADAYYSDADGHSYSIFRMNVTNIGSTEVSDREIMGYDESDYYGYY